MRSNTNGLSKTCKNLCAAYKTRIEYYEQDKKTVTESHIYDDRAIITDPSVFHRCFNQTPEWRYSLQITWNDEVKDIIERLRNVN